MSSDYFDDFTFEISDEELSEYKIIQSWFEVLKRTEEGKGIIDTYDEYLMSGLLSLVSTVMNRRFYYYNRPDESATLSDDEPDIAGQGKKYCNIWFNTIGISGETKKSTFLVKIVDALKKIEPLLVMPQDTTPQAFKTKFSDYNIRASYIDECSIIYEIVKKLSYMATYKEILTLCYDGTTLETARVTREDESLENPYLTMYWMTTDAVFSIIQVRLFQQGFGNRIMWIYPNYSRDFLKKLRNINLDDSTVELKRFNHRFLDAIFKFTGDVGFNFTEEGIELLDAFDLARYNLAKSIEDKLKKSYLARLPEFVEKLSGVFEVMKIPIEEIPNLPNSRNISLTSIKLAMIFVVNVVWKSYVTILDEIYKTEESKEMQSKIDFVLNKMKDLHRETGEEWIKRSDVYVKCRSRVDIKELGVLLQVLIHNDQITYDTIDGSKKKISVYKVIVDD